MSSTSDSSRGRDLVIGAVRRISNIAPQLQPFIQAEQNNWQWVPIGTGNPRSEPHFAIGWQRGKVKNLRRWGIDGPSRRISVELMIQRPKAEAARVLQDLYGSATSELPPDLLWLPGGNDGNGERSCVRASESIDEDTDYVADWAARTLLAFDQVFTAPMKSLGYELFKGRAAST